MIKIYRTEVLHEATGRVMQKTSHLTRFGMNRRAAKSRSNLAFTDIYRVVTIEPKEQNG